MNLLKLICDFCCLVSKSTLPKAVSILFKVEYILVKFDDENKTAQVSLRAEEALAKLNEKEAADPKGRNIFFGFFFSKRSSTIHLYFCSPHFRCKVFMAPRIWSLYGRRNTWTAIRWSTSTF